MRWLQRAQTLAVAAACGLLFSECTQGAGERRLRVFASSSLTAPFKEIADAFMARHSNVVVDLHFAGTPRLVVQLREGAPAGVFASADAHSMERVIAQPGIRCTEPVVFAHNQLAVVVAAGAAGRVRTLTDLAAENVRVLLCAPDVPAGRYAREVLDRAGLQVRSLSDEPNVRSVLTKVALGEVDAGIVYLTDTKGADPDRVRTVPIPARVNAVATYPIVAFEGEDEGAQGQAFIAFVRSAEGRAILDKAGFSVP